MTLEEAIKTAVQYETRIRDVYLAAARKVSEPAGKSFLKTMADDEQRHLDYLMDRLERWERTGKLTLPIDKNKVGVPFKSTKFDLVFGKGISRGYELVDLGVQTGVVSKKGAFYSWGDTRLGQGRDNARQYLEEHLEVAEAIEAGVRVAFRKPATEIVADVAEEELEVEL